VEEGNDEFYFGNVELAVPLEHPGRDCLMQSLIDSLDRWEVTPRS
jgi:hypothetical protein